MSPSVANPLATPLPMVCHTLGSAPDSLTISLIKAPLPTVPSWFITLAGTIESSAADKPPYKAATVGLNSPVS